MNRLLSSRWTFFMKFVWPAVVSAYVAWFLWVLLHAYAPSPLRHGLTAMSVGFALWTIWTAVLLKRVELTEGGLRVSNYFRSAVVPFSMIVRVNHVWGLGEIVIKVSLRAKYSGWKAVHFKPSVRQQLEDQAKRGFWQGFRWHPHPVVEELNRIIEERV